MAYALTQPLEAYFLLAWGYMISSWSQIYGFDMHFLTNQCSLCFISCTLQEFWVCVRPGCVLWCSNWTEHLPWNCLVSPGWLLHWFTPEGSLLFLKCQPKIMNEPFSNFQKHNRNSLRTQNSVNCLPKILGSLLYSSRPKSGADEVNGDWWQPVTDSCDEGDIWYVWVTVISLWLRTFFLC